jgi:hypothetical protein
VWCTVKGLRNGSLLVPEPAPAAATSPASATAPPAP